MSFQHLGYYKEYYIDNKFIGTIPCEKERDEIGYNGRKIETLKEKVILHNKKAIKSGTQVQTMIYPLSGKLEK